MDKKKREINESDSGIVKIAGTKPKLCKSKKEEVFTTSGICSDEITFLFDDGNKLYVSENFLRYVSPVFRAMFEHDFKETKSRTVKLRGKDYADFLEFLLCLHPETLKSVDKTNVLKICAIADEYQSALVKKCKEAMLNWLTEEAKHTSTSDPKDKSDATRKCLQILIKAGSLQYEEVTTKAVSTISSFGYKFFAGKAIIRYGMYCYNKKEINEAIADCKVLYDSLEETIKLRLLSDRLDQLDKTDFHE